MSPVRAPGAPALLPLLGGALHLAWLRDEAGISGGACDADPERARVRATGEYAQHVSHMAARDALPTRRDPGGLPTVEPAGTPRSTPMRWVIGSGMRDGAPVAVPAQAVLLGWDPPPPEVRWCAQTSVGTAAGRDHGQARTAALLEVVERHVLTRGWRTGDIRFERLDHLHEAVLPARLLDALRGHAVTLRTVRVAGIGPDVVLALLHRAGGLALTCGAAARHGTAPAVRHAVYEAVAARLALSRARPSSALQARERARGLAVAAAGPAHLAFVEARTTGDGTLRTAPGTPPPQPTATQPAEVGLAEVGLAERLFGRQPAEVELPDAYGHVVRRVVCHRSEVFEPLTPSADSLPCPVA
ncbi:YcaO-like family protein [Nonomuraea sp. SBT364]|uniref:YcaO-like family protein n=1 Tax=Nonomuraea sp. SBT364 TaxID=1580530 RepID=UPI00066A23E0|nr:YcaO-like family protein [Nonomuraea sp. SBT364]